MHRIDARAAEALAAYDFAVAEIAYSHVFLAIICTRDLLGDGLDSMALRLSASFSSQSTTAKSSILVLQGST